MSINSGEWRDENEDRDEDEDEIIFKNSKKKIDKESSKPKPILLSQIIKHNNEKNKFHLFFVDWTGYEW